MKEYKGMRIFQPNEHKKLARILKGWMQAATARGFQQYKTSVLDPIELYEGKTSEEIMREQTYRFTDRGGREVVLRPEITPGVSSMVVEMQNKRTLQTPLKVFTIGSVFRYENPQKGRKREHIQYNVDIFGEPAAWAEAEVIEVAFAAIEDIGLKKSDFEVRINDRSAMKTVLTDLGIKEEKMPEVLRLLDRREKMDESAFNDELGTLLDIDRSANTIDNELQKTPERVDEVINLLPKDISAEYDPKIIRGFDYYTGIVFEIFAKDKNRASRSITGGGRYDNLIETYGGTPLPAVGFGMGDVTLADCMQELDIKTDSEEMTTVVLCTTAKDMVKKAYAIGEKWRSGAKEHFTVSFIGFVPKKKLTDIYKRHEERARFVVSLDENNTLHARMLAKQETVESNDHNFIAYHLYKTYSI